MKSAYKHHIVCFLGMMSGFTLMISGNTLNFWLSLEEIDIRTIGFFSIITLPYAINFLWAPIIDTKQIPLFTHTFGHRISWIILLQILLSIATYLLSFFNPHEHIILFGILGTCISFLASTQDTVLGALRTEIINKKHQGAVSGTYIFGYRIGMLISSYGAFYLSDYISFDMIYELFSIIILIFPAYLIINANRLNSMVVENNSYTPITHSSNSGNFYQHSIQFIKNILEPVGTYKFIIIALIFLVLYRLPDHFIVNMGNPFFLKIGYSTLEIANAAKLFGPISAIIGGFLASYVMRHIKIIDSLIIFGSLHAASHLLYLVQELTPKNIYLLFFIIGTEGITGGMAMAAYIAFITSLCNGKFRATQYSFFTSMMGLSRSIFPAISGYIVASFGWDIFFIFTTIIAIPPIFIAIYLNKLSINKKVVS